MVVLLSLLGIEGFRAVRTVQDLRGGRDILLQTADLLEERNLDVTAAELDQAEDDFERAQEKIDRASGVLGSDLILSVASRLPWLGGQVDAARDLAEIGSHSAAIGSESVEALRAFQRVRDTEGGELSEKVVSVLDALDPHLTVIEDHLAIVREGRARIGDRDLVSPLESAIASLDQRLEDLEDRVANQRRAQEMAPMVLGYQGPQTYLVLAHDNNEIMGTGGFILVYGLLTVDKGRVERIFFDNVANLVDGDWPPTDGRDYFEPPAPLRLHLLGNWPMSLADASWWPDFPTAAKNAIEIYRVNSGDEERIDGVIGINFLTLETLLEVLGPITVEKYGETVTADDVTDKTLILTHPEALRPWETDRYDFTGYVAQEVLEETLTAGPEQWSPLIRALNTIGREKNLLLYHTDPAVQRAIADFGWDGGVRQEPGDYLMVVDATRRNKLSQVVKPSINLSVRFDARGDATNVATISYHNDYSAWAQGKDPRLAGLVISWGSVSLYGTYVRLLAPEGSLLARVAVGGLPVEVEEVSTESSRSVFGHYLSVPLDAIQEVSYTYLVPAAVDISENPYEYRLLVQKQPGTRAIPLTVSVEVPPGMRIVSIELDGDELDGGVDQIVTDLQQDRQIVVRYAPRG